MAGRIIVGPVIGKVTRDSARILIETDRDTKVTCRATSPGGPERTVSGDCKRGRPSVLRLMGLGSDADYTLALAGAACDVPAGFRTLPERPSALNIGAVSCNFTIRKGDDDLWARLGNVYIKPRTLHLLFHLGDQIYGDSAFQEAVALLGDRTKGTKTQEQAILERYRTLYRMTWGHPPTRSVLANVPNLMIWDDHEIRDDWGSRPADRDPASQAQYIGTLARRVFRDYQRQLWTDVPGDDVPAGELEFHAHRWGDVGAVFLDQRAARSFSFDPLRPYLGEPQWTAFRNSLSPGGALADLRALILITSVPLAFIGSSLTTAGGSLDVDGMDDLQDHWAYGDHRKEQIEMIRELRRWKEAGDGQRNLIVLGGDVHIGCHTDIRYENKTLFRQVITSPITNSPPSWFQFLGLRTMLEVEQGLGNRYSFEHYHYTRRRNFAVVMVRVPDSGEPTIEGSHVLEK